MANYSKVFEGLVFGSRLRRAVLGCTLWTDYAIYGDTDAGMREAAAGPAGH